MDKVELTTMCAIINEDKVLMINRKKNWTGWSFPGGHLEENESVIDCVIREIKEETGLSIHKIEYKGLAHFFNSETKKRYIVNNFTCTSYEGNLKHDCEEGQLKWVAIENIRNQSLAEGMEYRLPLFFESGIKELYVSWNDKNGYTNVNYNNM